MGHKPDGFHTVTPYLNVQDVNGLIDFVERAFGATEVLRTTQLDGSVNHAQLKIGDSMLEMSQGSEKWPAMPVGLHLYVPDADTIYKKAIQAGATSLYEPQDMPYGDHEGGVKDAWGNNWYIATYLGKGGSQ